MAVSVIPVGPAHKMKRSVTRAKRPAEVKTYQYQTMKKAKEKAIYYMELEKLDGEQALGRSRKGQQMTKIKNQSQSRRKGDWKAYGRAR
jgi:hypothetical protein